jgi:phage FluMu protein Com
MMADGVRCSNCGTLIAGEPSGGDPSQRKPCPRCGSFARIFEVTMSGGITIGASATAVLITYPEAPLTRRAKKTGGCPSRKPIP